MPELRCAGKSLPGFISVEVEDDQRVLRMSGEIDAEVVDAFREKHPAAPLITAVDLAGVTFLSSAGLSFLIRQTHPGRQAGRLPVLRGVTRPAHRVMQIAGATGLFQPAA
ncbi:STAS domain-containing protein [Blastococcus mobilis]|uniref:Anti-anti-sigma factor n=1 Tax=Blastococcus mobilis TaxID=1938746 RepID=A0A238Z8I8_9ACTN|nr:STAS domain-containing protein [Blastococcus mobilis]SNR79796.1 anti-anti-sigma factor [Blastococcus mobilis]